MDYVADLEFLEYARDPDKLLLLERNGGAIALKLQIWPQYEYVGTRLPPHANHWFAGLWLIVGPILALAARMHACLFRKTKKTH